MTTRNSSTTRYWYTPRQGYEGRSLRRLQADLGVGETAAETILHLREQVLELQAQLWRMQVELAAQAASQELRLAQFNDYFFEANWIELKIQE